MTRRCLARFGTATAVLVLASATLVVVTQAQTDPRYALVDLQTGGDPESLLRVVEEAQRQPLAGFAGLEYLRGRLLVEVDRQQEALQSYVSAISSTPLLAPHSRFRLAESQADLGRPDVAAGLVAKLLAGGPPRSLIAPALNLLERSLSDGGDCKVLRQIEGSRLGDDGRRRLQLVRAVCSTRAGDRATADAWLLALLESNHRDDSARQAAAMVAAGQPTLERSARAHMLLGMAFHNHREFDLAIQHLSRAIARLPESKEISRAEAHDTRYALARSHFWQERFHVAGALFGSLARDTRTPSLRARAFYQQGRCLELEERWDQAIPVYQQAYRVEPSGGWSSSALLAQLRLHWRSGREREALEILRTIEGRRRASEQRRALLFLASSDLVQNRADRTGAWLTQAERLTSGDAMGEVAYWQGRHAELVDDPAQAVEHYRSVLARDPHDPFAYAARDRLALSALRPAAEQVGMQLARSNRLSDLQAAALLLGEDHEVGRISQETLRTRLDSDPAASPFLRLTQAPPGSWPLLQQAHRRPEDMLLSLGLWQEGSSAVLRHFPVSNPTLAFTGSLMLARAGETRRSLYIAEILHQRVPDRLPAQLLPTAFRRLLYPFRYGYLILREAGEQDIDPYLLSAIIREESRYDARALSGAAARGLTQFVLPTARRLATKIGRSQIEPEDLEQPETSIALGAAYLRELDDRFDGDLPRMIVAYNAGEAQADAWKRYCFSDDPAEFYTKVTFRETRGYLDKVLTSYAHYRELYARDGA